MACARATARLSSTWHEMQLLLCCARTTVDSNARERIDLLVKRETNWDALLQLARRHRVAAMLYHQLNTNVANAVPPAVLQRLRAQFELNANRNQLLTNQLVRLLQLLQSNGITGLPFKGPAVATALYGDSRLREFADLDILVRERDVLPARRLLLAQGLRMLYPLSETQQSAALPILHDCPLISEDRKLWFELHWMILQWYFTTPLESERLWDDVGSVTLAGCNVPDLRPRDLLILLCAHGTKHTWERLAWICDIAEFLRTHRSLDWDSVLCRAREQGGLRMLLIAVLLAHQLLDSTIPPPVRDALRREPVARILVDRICRRLTRCPTHSSEVTKVRIPFITIPLDLALFQVRFHLHTKERVLDRIQYCWRLVIELCFTALARRIPQALPYLSRLPGWKKASLFTHCLVPPTAVLCFVGLGLQRITRAIMKLVRFRGSISNSVAASPAHGKAA